MTPALVRKKFAFFLSEVAPHCHLARLVPLLTIFLNVFQYFKWGKESSNWFFYFVILLAGVSMLVVSKWAEKPWGWGLVALSHTKIFVEDWYIFNNHDFLIFFWNWVLFLAHWGPSPGPEERVAFLRTNAKFMLGFMMIFAFLHKILSPTFMNGTFLYLSFLTDQRFTSFLSLWGRDAVAHFSENQELLGPFREAKEALPEILLKGTSSRLEDLAAYLSSFLLTIEGAIGILFLCPATPIFYFFRNLLLTTFILGTYSFLPIPSFEIILLIFGIAQLKDEDRFWPVLYGLLLVHPLIMISLPSPAYFTEAF